MFTLPPKTSINLALSLLFVGQVCRFFGYTALAVTLESVAGLLCWPVRLLWPR